MAARPELPPDYYLDNFHTLLDFVWTHHRHLLTEAECAFITSLRGVTEPARRLYVRLIMRRGPVFRVTKLSYPEITDVPLAVRCLQAAGLADDAADLDAKSCLNLLTRPELAALPEAINLPRTLTKPALVAALAEQGAQPAEPLVRPQGLDHLRVIKLLFFGNFNQDLTEFVLNDLGIMPYEQYRFDPARNWLQDRAAIDLALVLDDCATQVREHLEAGEGPELTAALASLPQRPAQPVLARRFDRIVNRIARQLEREGDLRGAYSAYETSCLPPSRERRARILHNRGETASAIALCKEILKAPHSEPERYFAEGFEARIDKGRRRRQRFKPIQDSVTVARGEARVELAAAAHLNAIGCDARYVENTLLPGIFGLAFWDIVFADISDAFYNPFQRGPADLYDDFRRNRQAMIDARLDQLRDPAALINLASYHFANKHGLANPFVVWPAMDLALIGATIDALGERLLGVFDRILADPRHHRSGFPDLVVFQGDGIEFVEVKGPGDKLQDNQVQWLQFFAEYGIPARVLNVNYA